MRPLDWPERSRCMEPIVCPFCSPEKEYIVKENQFAYTLFDKYPVNPGHSLIIPFRHFSSIFEATVEELQAIWELIRESKVFLDARYSPDGYNIGVNSGEAAGQTVMHLHVHLIPRYKGDMENPRGGVRGAIPYKQKY
jgi:diadenosine tetraphosphate (Ap4A) HIT family hydrolase